MVPFQHADRPLLRAAPWKWVAVRHWKLGALSLLMLGELRDRHRFLLPPFKYQILRRDWLKRPYPKLMPMWHPLGLREHRTLRVKPLKRLPRVW